MTEIVNGGVSVGCDANASGHTMETEHPATMATRTTTTVTAVLAGYVRPTIETDGSTHVSFGFTIDPAESLIDSTRAQRIALCLYSAN